MNLNKTIIFSRILLKKYSPTFAKLSYSSEANQVSFSHLIKRLDESIKDASEKSENHDLVVNIAKEFIKNKYTFQQNSIFLSRICKYDKLNQDFWSEYISELNDFLSKGDNRNVKVEFKDSSVNDLNVLLTFSKSLITAKLLSKPFAIHFMKSVFRSIHEIIPYKIEIFNSMLDYLVHGEFKEPMPDFVFDILIEFAGEMKTSDLIHVMFNLGNLGHKNEEMIQTFSRILNNNISKGLLTPYEKTKLAKSYSLMKYEHITFFNHISKELMFIFGNMDFDNFFKNGTLDENHENGIGSPKCEPSGVIVDVMKYIRFHGSERNQKLKEPKHVEFKSENDQLYTCGQMVYILDSMVYLKLHHLESDFKKLVNYALKHLFKEDIVQHFDVEQLRCCVTLLAACRKSVSDSLLESITTRFIKEYISGNVNNSQLSLFLKDLVKLTKIVVKRNNIRNKLLHITNFVPPKWINNPLDRFHDIADPNSSRSMLEHLCYKICDNVNTFKMKDLTSCLRSISYLGFKNPKFFNVFVPFLRQNLSNLDHVDVSNITQAFNKAGVKDKFLFYLLGKQHQLHIHNSQDNLYIKRIG